MSNRRERPWDSRCAAGVRVVDAYTSAVSAQADLWDAVADLDASGGWAVDGARSLAAWLAAHLGIGIGHGAQLLALARGARAVPAVAEAVRAGELSEPKARLLLEARTDARAEYVTRDVDVLIDQAATLRMVDVRTMVKHWAARVDAEIEAAALETATGQLPPAGELEAVKDSAFRLRRFDLGSPCLDTVVFDGASDAEGASIIQAALEAWQRMDQPDTEVRMADQRSAAQRRHDAMVGICRYFLLTVASPAIGGERPTINVVVDLHPLTRERGGIGLTDRGASLTAEQVRQLCCDAKVNRVVMAGPSAVLDLGTTTRTPSLHLRRAVTVRDRHCRFPGCAMPGRYCDAHHIVYWADGGPTDPTNLMLLCGHHHRVIHDAHWEVRGDANDRLTFTRPDGTEHTEPVLRVWRPPPEPPGERQPAA